MNEKFKNLINAHNDELANWEIFFAVAYGAYFMVFSKIDFGFDLSILVSSALSALGAVVGYKVGLWANKHNWAIKISTLLAPLLLILSVNFAMKATQKEKEGYSTCEVCGYVSYNNNKGICDMCFSEGWDDLNEIDKKEYNNHDAWLIEEQLFMFALDSVNAEINFIVPYDSIKFPKDPKWKPLISKEDLVKQYNSEKNE